MKKKNGGASRMNRDLQSAESDSSRKVCVAYGRGGENDVGKIESVGHFSGTFRIGVSEMGVLGTFTVAEHQDQTRKNKVQDPSYCSVSYSDCKRFSLFTGSEIWLFSSLDQATRQLWDGKMPSSMEGLTSTKENEFLTVVNVIPDITVAPGSIILEERRRKMLGLKLREKVVVALCKEAPDVCPAKRVTLILNDYISTGKMPHLTGIRMYVAAELETSVRYISAGRGLQVQYLGKRRHLTVASVEPLGEVPSSYTKLFKVCPFTAVVILPKDFYNNEENIKGSFRVSRPYGLDTQITMLREIAKMALFDVTGIDRLGIKMPKGILITGPKGSGKGFVATYVAKMMNVKAVYLKSDDLILHDSSNRSFLESIMDTLEYTAPSILILKDIDTIIQRDAEDARPYILEKIISIFNLNNSRKVLIIATTSGIEGLDQRLRRPGRLEYEIEIGMPSSQTINNILSDLLKNWKHTITESDLEEISSSAHGYTGSDIVSVYLRAQALANKNADNEITIQHLRSGLKEIKPRSMRGVSLEVPEVLWDHIAGNERIKDRLKEAIEFPLRHRALLEKYRITQAKGLLLYGPPGCSKTLMAKAIATESKLNFLAVKGPELFSKWVGESEKGVREVFRRARSAAPSVIFFDEIDSIASKRSSQSGETSVKDRLLSQLLTEMDGIEGISDVIIIAATNRPDLIDSAFLRPGRIDRMLYVGPPDKEARMQIFRMRFNKCNCDIDVSPEYLANKTDGYSGAECVHLVHEACMAALEETIKVEKLLFRHFEVAFLRVKPQITVDIIEFYEKFRRSSRIKQI